MRSYPVLSMLRPLHSVSEIPENGMQPPVTGRRQWGGCPEAFILAYRIKIRIFLLIRCGGDKVRLLHEPLGKTTSPPVGVVWSGTHYDSLDLTVEMARKLEAVTPAGD